MELKTLVENIEVKSGVYKNITTTSFFPAKPLGCCSDGGAIFTEDEELAKNRFNQAAWKRSEKYDNIQLASIQD